MSAVPSRIGAYEIVRPLRSGGMGTVYLGRDPELDRPVAIKVLRERVQDEELLERFLREARAAAALRHPNIVTIYASGQHEQQPFIAMEFIDGESLDQVIRRQLPLTLSDRISYIDQMCAGLHFAHRAGIVHRDVKPANVMVDRDGVVRILDFGIARIEGSGMTQDGAMMGTLNYMSPEQMLGRAVDFRSDIFAVGAVAYELLSYQRAFKGSVDSGLLVQLPYQDPQSLRELTDGLPPELEQVVMKALQKAPDDRFADLAEMRGALLRLWDTLERDAALETILIPRGGVGQAQPSSGTHAPSSHRTPSDTYGLRSQSRETVERMAREPRSPSVTVARPPAVEDTRTEPAPRRDRRAYLLIAAVVGLLATGAVVWWLTGRVPAGAPEVTRIAEAPPVPAPSLAPVDRPVTPPPVNNASPAPPPASGVATAVRPGAAAPGTAGAPVLPRESPGSAAAEAAIQDLLARVTTMYTAGELGGALDSLGKSPAAATDNRVGALASRVADAAFDMMASAERTATSRNAADLAGDVLRRGTEAKARAESLRQRSDFVGAGAEALAARELFQTAAASALAAAARSQPAVNPVAAPVTAASPPAAAPVTAASLVQREQAGILAAVGRFQAAYRDRDINALMKAYPSLRREARQKIEASFKTCRAYDVNFSDEQILIDPTNANSASVNLRSTYACTVRTGQAPKVAESRDVFVLRKTGDFWIIESTGTIN